jgi:hypothetical protein
MSDAGEIVGMVDVLKLTYATLDQINSMASADGEGPAWNKFWMSLDNETESVMSGEGSTRPPMTPDGRSMMSHDIRPTVAERGDSVLPNDSASHNGLESPEHSAITGAHVDSLPFTFKFKAPSGRMHRLQVVAAAGIAELVYQISQKLGAEADAIGGSPDVSEGSVGKTGFHMSYLDNEGDTVSITTDNDLLEAITLASRGHRDKVDLFVHNPEQPAHPATLDPHPALAKPPSPTESSIRERKKFVDEEDEEDVETHRRQRAVQAAPLQEQIIAGVPNDLLLPGAIVTLAVVILGVFTISRAANR